MTKNNSSKVVSTNKAAEIVAKYKKQGNKVGLITGCFDILHIGHISTFRYAKKHVDILVVGLDSDKTISNSKGPNRPINKLKQRCKMLSELSIVDLVFPIDFVIKYRLHSSKIDTLYNKLYGKIDPDYLITHVTSDKFWECKKKQASKMGIKFLGEQGETLTTSTKIIREITNNL